MNIHAETKILLPEHFPDDIPELKYEEIEKIIDVANQVLVLSSQEKAKDIVAIFSNNQNRLPVSVQFNFTNEEPPFEERHSLRGIKISFTDRKTHEEAFWKEIKRRNLTFEFEKVDEFRKKYYTPPESSLYIAVDHNTTNIMAERLFEMDKLIVSFENGKISSLSVYNTPIFQDEVKKIIFITWDKNGVITKADINTPDELLKKEIGEEEYRRLKLKIHSKQNEQ
jgi:hypothetical protein